MLVVISVMLGIACIQAGNLAPILIITYHQSYKNKYIGRRSDERIENGFYFDWGACCLSISNEFAYEDADLDYRDDPAEPCDSLIAVEEL